MFQQILTFPLPASHTNWGLWRTHMNQCAYLDHLGYTKEADSQRKFRVGAVVQWIGCLLGMLQTRVQSLASPVFPCTRNDSWYKARSYPWTLLGVAKTKTKQICDQAGEWSCRQVEKRRKVVAIKTALCEIHEATSFISVKAQAGWESSWSSAQAQWMQSYDWSVVPPCVRKKERSPQSHVLFPLSNSHGQPGPSRQHFAFLNHQGPHFPDKEASGWWWLDLVSKMAVRKFTVPGLSAVAPFSWAAQ